MHFAEVLENSDMTDNNWLGNRKDPNSEQTPEYYNKVLAWFKTMPKIEHTISYTNPKSGKDFKLKLQGIKDFF